MKPPSFRVPAVCIIDQIIWQQYHPLVFEGYKDHSWLVTGFGTSETYLAVMTQKSPSLKEFQIHCACDEPHRTTQTSFTITSQGLVRSCLVTFHEEGRFDDHSAHAGFRSPADQVPSSFIDESIDVISRVLNEIKNYGRSMPTVAQQILNPRGHSR